MHHADNLVVVVEHRVAGVALTHPGPELLDRVVDADGIHPGARDHRVLHVPLGKVEDAIQEHGQLPGEVAALPGVGEDVLQVTRGGGVLDVMDGLDPQQSEQEVRRLVEDLDQPAEQREVDRRRPRQP